MQTLFLKVDVPGEHGMTEYNITKTESAYAHPLLIRHLLSRLTAQHESQEIVFSDQQCFSYRQFFERVCQFATA